MMLQILMSAQVKMEGANKSVLTLMEVSSVLVILDLAVTLFVQVKTLRYY